MGGSRPRRSRAERERARARRARALARATPAVAEDAPPSGPPEPPPAPPARVERPGPVRRFLGVLSRGYGLDHARAYGRMIWILVAGTILSYVGLGIAIPFKVIYLTSAVGVSYAAVGVAVVVEEVVRALLSPVFGLISDRIGRKPLMVGGLLLQSVSLLALLLVTGPVTLVLVGALLGLAYAPYHPAMSALVADLAPRDRRVGVFGLVHMSKNTGYALGLVAGALLIAQDFRVLFSVAAVFPVLFACTVGFLVREPARRGRAAPQGHFLAPFRAIARSPRFVLFLLLAVAVFLSWGQMKYVLPTFVEGDTSVGLGERWVTIAFLVNAVLVLLLQVPVSVRAENWVRAHGLAAAGAVTATGFIVLGTVATLFPGTPALLAAGLLVSVVVFTLAEMIETPLIFALASDLAPPDVMGGAMGVLGLAAPVGMASPLFITALLGSAGLGWPWVWGSFALVTLAGAGGFLAFAKRGAAITPAADVAASAD